jgi:hypothetical protein
MIINQNINERPVHSTFSVHLMLNLIALTILERGPATYMAPLNSKDIISRPVLLGGQWTIEAAEVMKRNNGMKEKKD